MKHHVHHIARKVRAHAILLGLAALASGAAVAQTNVEGKLEVNGKAVAITQVYAYAVEGFFDKKKQDVTVLMCDAAVPPAAIRDSFARKELVDAGKLHCVQQVINADKQVINFEVRDKAFGGRQPGGGSTEHVFEATNLDSKSISGRARTKSPQKSFDDIPYSYDIRFTAPVEPKK
ncbi:hypothetical protein BH11PSE11_BH11PSE11_33290 [soil metagenome]